MRRVAKIGGLAAIAAFVLIQLVPYGRAHDNPSETRAVRFATADGRQLMIGSCGDCHTNLTTWRWYSNIAPVSWLVAKDVDGGRSELNFSEWDKPQPELSELLETIDDGGMPPLQYTLPHPSAKLSDNEKLRLKAALTELYKRDPPRIELGGG